MTPIPKNGSVPHIAPRTCGIMTAEATAPEAVPHKLSVGERYELMHMGLIDESGQYICPQPDLREPLARPIVKRKRISNPNVLNEAFAYKHQSVSFSRGLRVEMPAAASMLYISGTASVDEDGRTIHVNDFRAQCWRTWRNITELLRSEGAGWQDLVRTTCYVRDIERDYWDFNDVRARFFAAQRLDPYPASTCIQARICRSDLLVEIEAIAIVGN